MGGGGAAGFLAHNVEKRVEKLEKREELYNVYVSPVSYSFRDAREIEQYVKQASIEESKLIGLIRLFFVSSFVQ